jgi:SAM-dependent methyltransferase
LAPSAEQLDSRRPAYIPADGTLVEKGIGSVIAKLRAWAGRSPAWTPLFLHHRALGRYVESRVPSVFDLASVPSARVLDVGCGDMPFRAFFERDARCGAYEGADIPGSGSKAAIEIDPTTQRIAAPDAAYDVVVAFQVLEHSAQPVPLLRECHRVLKPGGVLFATLPFVFEYHAVPGDFRRWTTEGIAEELASVGFQQIAVDPIETDLQSLIVINELYLTRQIGYVITKPLFLVLNAAALAADKLRRQHPHRVLPLTIGVVGRTRAIP